MSNMLRNGHAVRRTFVSLLLLLGVHLAGANAEAQSCGASVSWFSNPSFPVDVSDGTSNCAFHQFAYQSLIAAVQASTTSPGELVFESWMPDYGVFVPQNTPVTPWGQQPAAPCTGAGGRARTNAQFFRVRVPKSATDVIDPDSTQQATGDPLFDQANNIVYYGIWMNQTEYNFITSCQLYNGGCIQAAPATTALPPGTIEVKTAWRTFTGTPPTDMYTVQGVVGSTCTPVTLGLVGFHLVINTPTHPEFIWATFEHVRNAPDCQNPQPTPQGGWSFNNPACKQNGQPCPTNQPKVVPTQVCRATPWGGGSSQNVANIQSLNQSVSSTLQKLIATDPQKYAAMAVWLNYQLVGNLWTVNGQLPPSPSVQAGSLLDSNTTMETFFQQSGNNCFVCHNLSPNSNPPLPSGAPANLSHLFEFVQQSGGCGGGQLPPACQPSAKKALFDPIDKILALTKTERR